MVALRGPLFLLLLFFSSFFGSIFLLAPLLPLMLISTSLYRWITDRIIATWFTFPVALIEMVLGVKLVITGDGFFPGERSVIIMNHRTRLDWMFLWNCLLRCSYLRKQKICLKDTLKSLPGFGWAMQVAAFIFIRRKWEEDRTHLEAMLRYFCEIKQPLQLLMFPEGTDLTPFTQFRSHEYAEQSGLSKYEYVLHPRTTGFAFIVDQLRKGANLDAIHDVTVAYPYNFPQTERQLFTGNFPKEIHFHIYRHSVDSLPSSPDGLKAWCQQRWRAKEKLLKSFYGGQRSFKVQGEGLVPHCKSELRVFLIKCASLLFWLPFIAAAFVLVYTYTAARWYFTSILLFFIFQEKVFGGCEVMELACHAGLRGQRPAQHHAE
ncbi:lysocardiolipin acyltransferase 1 [Callorhinchus milii]|uniref:Lysocardiolipin acyltransferase 1 n=1 Tax=Callorhinchus milii TaxID=7868 RepID=V9KQS1_CALMI|nr:lysocardiolipin acyltransferase 1 [Callorhinchus milii]XP_042189177.1 lysocardiolipin acyltransferase 1 [Callorhinchus milii]|eukprot:gi/632960967/ref/XP_007896497.1/ PREDICTED: lysocardiolipin acyltransferase 1 [Callorhinchus milii]